MASQPGPANNNNEKIPPPPLLSTSSPPSSSTFSVPTTSTPPLSPKNSINEHNTEKGQQTQLKMVGLDEGRIKLDNPAPAQCPDQLSSVPALLFPVSTSPRLGVKSRGDCPAADQESGQGLTSGESPEKSSNTGKGDHFEQAVIARQQMSDASHASFGAATVSAEHKQLNGTAETSKQESNETKDKPENSSSASSTPTLLRILNGISSTSLANGTLSIQASGSNSRSTSRKDFPCTDCGRAYGSPRNLQRHRNICKSNQMKPTATIKGQLRQLEINNDDEIKSVCQKVNGTLGAEKSKEMPESNNMESGEENGNAPGNGRKRKRSMLEAKYVEEGPLASAAFASESTSASPCSPLSSTSLGNVAQNKCENCDRQLCSLRSLRRHKNICKATVGQRALSQRFSSMHVEVGAAPKQTAEATENSFKRSRLSPLAQSPQGPIPAPKLTSQQKAEAIAKVADTVDSVVAKLKQQNNGKASPITVLAPNGTVLKSQPMISPIAMQHNGGYYSYAHNPPVQQQQSQPIRLQPIFVSENGFCKANTNQMWSCPEQVPSSQPQVSLSVSSDNLDIEPMSGDDEIDDAPLTLANGSTSNKVKNVYRHLCPECDKPYSCRKNVKRHRVSVHQVSAVEAQTGAIKKIQLLESEIPVAKPRAEALPKKDAGVEALRPAHAGALTVKLAPSIQPPQPDSGPETKFQPYPSQVQPYAPSINNTPPFNHSSTTHNYYYYCSENQAASTNNTQQPPFSAPPTFNGRETGSYPPNPSFSFGSPPPQAYSSQNVQRSQMGYARQPQFGASGSGSTTRGLGVEQQQQLRGTAQYSQFDPNAPNPQPQFASPVPGYLNTNQPQSYYPQEPGFIQPNQHRHSFDLGSSNSSRSFPYSNDMRYSSSYGQPTGYGANNNNLADLDYWDQIKSDVDRPFVSRSRDDDLEMARIVEDLKRSAEGEESPSFHQNIGPVNKFPQPQSFGMSMEVNGDQNPMASCLKKAVEPVLAEADSTFWEEEIEGFKTPTDTELNFAPRIQSPHNLSVLKPVALVSANSVTVNESIITVQHSESDHLQTNLFMPIFEPAQQKQGRASGKLGVKKRTKKLENGNTTAKSPPRAPVGSGSYLCSACNRNLSTDYSLKRHRQICQKYKDSKSGVLPQFVPIFEDKVEVTENAGSNAISPDSDVLGNSSASEATPTHPEVPDSTTFCATSSCDALAEALECESAIINEKALEMKSENGSPEK